MKFTLHSVKKSNPSTYACIISGDGLMNPLSISLAEKLAEKGIPTARLKAIKYFWNKRVPKRMSVDLQRYMARRLKKNPSAHFIFIGYSFGAGTLPFALNRLPEEMKSHIDIAVLIAPPAKVDFKFFFRSWLHKSTSKACDSAPEIQYLSDRIPVLYIYGEDDYKGPREDLTPFRNLTLVCLAGGHDFNKDYPALFQTIFDAVQSRKQAQSG